MRSDRRRLRGWAAAAIVTAVIAGAWMWRQFVVEPGDRSTVTTGVNGERRLVVAVAPFYGPDDESAKEGRVMAALVERAITTRLGAGATVLGVDETKQPLRTHEAARVLGANLGATMVVWGEAFAVRGETEILPYFTMVPRTPSGSADHLITAASASAFLADPSTALLERESEPTIVQAQEAHQIELRRTSAAGVGDIVLLLAGTHALYASQAEKALALFQQGPRTAERLRYQAKALQQLRRGGEALKLLEDAASLVSSDAKTLAMLGDAHMAANHFAEAIDAYHRASDAGGSFATEEAILYDGKLYARETYRDHFVATPIARDDTGYMLALDPATGRVLERHQLPGRVKAFETRDGRLEVTYDIENSYGAMSRYATIEFAADAFRRPVALPTSLRLRRNAMNSGENLAAHFSPNGDRFDAPRQTSFDDVPPTVEAVEAAARAARERDPTQPWHIFILGQALWSQGRRSEATNAWQRMFAGAYPATPYYEYAKMAYEYERFGQRPWADRAFGEALQRRRHLNQPVDLSTLIERLIDVPNPGRLLGLDLERAHTWLDRTRQLSGLTEGDEFAAAIWEKHFRERSDLKGARHEQETRERALTNALYSSTIATFADYAFYAFVATSVTLWIAVIGVAVGKRAKACGPLAVAAVIALVAAGPFAMFTYRLERVQSPVQTSDSFGGALNIQYLEARLQTCDTPATRFATAVAHHLAGETERARQLYVTLGADPRAVRNLAALNAGLLVPPESVTSSDFFTAMTAVPVARWPAAFWSGLEGLRFVFLLDGLAALAVVMLGVTRERNPRTRREDPISTGGIVSRTRRLFFFLPGVEDIVRGNIWRGIVSAELFCFAFAAGIAQLLLRGWIRADPAVGPLTAIQMSGLIRAFPLPTASGVTQLTQPYPYWTFFWSYRGAPLFWSAVALAAVASIVLHVTGTRRARVRARRRRTGTNAVPIGGPPTMD